MSPRRATPTALAVLLLLGGCAAPASGSPVATVDTNVVVYAAASLAESFGVLQERFEAAHPGIAVTVNYGGSSALAQAIIEGAPADVLAAASTTTMNSVTSAGLVQAEPKVFARNILEIAVPAGNPGRVTGLEDFGDPARTIALCAPEVPCGAATIEIFEAAGISPAPDTLEQDVKAALTKVELGEVDAALVYATDVLAAGAAVHGIEFPESQEAVNDYPIAVLAGAADPHAAAAFVEFVLDAEGQAVLADAGFRAP